MGKGGYTGGSTLIGRGGDWATRDPAALPQTRNARTRDGNAPKKLDAETAQIMAEHDRLRARGVDPVSAGNKKDHVGGAATAKAQPVQASGLTKAEEKRRAFHAVDRLEKEIAVANRELADLHRQLEAAKSRWARLKPATPADGAPEVRAPSNLLSRADNERGRGSTLGNDPILKKLADELFGRHK